MTTNVRRSSIVVNRTHCVALLSKLVAKSRMDPSHVLFRRDCYRWALKAPAAIRYQAADGTQVALEATVENLAAAGIGLLCQESLPADLPVEVFVSAEGRMYSAAARVTHSTAIPEGFRIGCEFAVETKGE